MRHDAAVHEPQRRIYGSMDWGPEGITDDEQGIGGRCGRIISHIAIAQESELEMERSLGLVFRALPHKVWVADVANRGL